MMQESPPDIGQKIKQLRSSKALTLDRLARLSGISKSMLSQIERNKTNPTVGTLWSITRALGVEISDILGKKSEKVDKDKNISTMKSHQTPEIQSADGKCSLRILAPLELVSHIEWYEITIDPDGILSSSPHVKGTREHLTLLTGSVIIGTIDGEEEQHILESGDTARYNADIQHYIKNNGRKRAYAILLVHTSQ